ncbi:MAG: ABC transporter ATP-binding protein [Spirochaetes bacterium]|nr:ABC transporter ATP-binding protein [Spirochaetota bacterium]
MPLIEVKNLSRYFGGLHAVDNVSFNVEKGIIKAIIGPNGAGKTTLFNLISGTINVTSGKVFYKDHIITGLKPYQIAKKGIVRTFQNLKLNQHMSVLENVMIGRHIRSKAGFISGMLNLPNTWNEEKKIREYSMKMLDVVSMADKKDITVANLPFGQQRAVELARALACEPEVLLLDEPASGLNIYETKELSELIKKLKTWGLTILIVEHDMSLVMDISDDVVVLNYGEKIAEGQPDKIQKNKKVIKIYLGDDDA